MSGLLGSVKGAAGHMLLNNTTALYYVNSQRGPNSNQFHQGAIKFWHFFIKEELFPQLRVYQMFQISWAITSKGISLKVANGP